MQLSTQFNEKSKTRVPIALFLLCLFLFAGIVSIKNQLIVQRFFHYRELRQKGDIISTQVKSVSEERTTNNNKTERFVTICIKWPVKQDDGYSIEDPILVEKWALDAPSYSVGDPINVYFLQYPRKGSEIRFGLSTTHNLDL